MTTFLAVLGAVGALGGFGGLVAFLNARAVRGKLEAEADKINNEARVADVSADDILLGRALEMYEKAMQAAERAEVRVAQLDCQVRALRDHVDHLERIMRNEGLDPPKFEWPKGA